MLQVQGFSARSGQPRKAPQSSAEQMQLVARMFGRVRCSFFCSVKNRICFTEDVSGELCPQNPKNLQDMSTEGILGVAVLNPVS